MSAKELLAEIKQLGLIKAGNIQDELNALAVSQEEEIISLNQQLSAKTISEQNIINAFGISGEGAHSKLVIEYVHGLVAENAALKESRRNLSEFIHEELDTDYPLNMEIETPSTDAFTAELHAQGVDALALHMEFNGYSNEASGAREFAANLRAGREGWV